MVWVLLALTLGLNVVFWGAVGLLRVVDDAATRRRGGAASAGRVPAPAEVAVLMAAHNEELVLSGAIEAARRLVPAGNIFIVSDASTDATVELAEAAGATVLDLRPNRGKAGALAAGIEHFRLDERFEVVLLLDADTHLDPDYLATGLPLFADPEVVAVAGRASTLWEPERTPLSGQFLLAYRERLYVAVQLLLKYGQAWRRANVVPIVPGFASMYRTRVLADIDVAASGLVIEDFNMTFEVHAKRLGRIAFHPGAAVAYTQDPDNLADYRKQVRRWILGFWQTVRRHRLHPGRFWVAVAVFAVEVVTASVMFVLLVPVLVLSTVAAALVAAGTVASGPLLVVSDVIAPTDVLLGVVLPDYLLTVLAAAYHRRPRFLLLGLGFLAMRVLDAWIALGALRQAFGPASTGVWVSPTRRGGAGPTAVVPAPGRRRVVLAAAAALVAGTVAVAVALT